jgi:hypothetical protein
VQFLLDSGALSCYCGETGYDGAIQEAEARQHFAVAALIREHAAHDADSDSDIIISKYPQKRRKNQNFEPKRLNPQGSSRSGK